MDGGSRYQLISVERTDNGIAQSAAVTGANVRIITPDGISMQATEDVPTPDGRARWNGMYRVDLNAHGVFRPQPGATYTLTVTVPSGARTITGTTTMPTPAGVDPGTIRPLFNRQTDTLRMAWPRAKGAATYQVTIECAIPSGDATIFAQYSFFADTAFALPGTARTLDNDPVFFDGSIATVYVHAVDDNYYSYYHVTTDPFAGAPPSRLHGALGVFGSMAVVTHTTFPVR